MGERGFVGRRGWEWAPHWGGVGEVVFDHTRGTQNVFSCFPASSPALLDVCMKLLSVAGK